MRYALFIAPLLVSVFAAATRAATVSAPHVTVTFEGVTAGQAKAIAETLSAAHKAYAEHFGFDMPGMVHCSVECGAGKASRLFTDGNDRVFLSLPSADKLLRPSKSGTFNLYGLCHELGHVAMYRLLKNRDWMTTAGAEGWAHYAGSLVVDIVYEVRGEKLWGHDPYDYRADGMDRLDEQLAAKAPSDIAKGAGEWKKLGAIIGPRGFEKVFQALESSPPAAPPAASALAEALTRADPGHAEAVTKWWAGAAPVLFEAREASAFKAAGIDKVKLERRPLRLEHDDGKGEGKKSVAGGGHARRFRAPGGGEWYLTGVSLYGSRYGRPAPDATFEVALCDAEMKPVAVWKHPYRLFDGPAKWVRIEIRPTRVPPGEDGFYVCFNFRPTATQGVYAFFDDSTKGKEESSSRTATPGDAGSAFAAGDWMIRAELDRPKAADALGGAEAPRRTGK